MPKTRWLSTRNNSEIGILAAKKISGFDSTLSAKRTQIAQKILADINK